MMDRDLLYSFFNIPAIIKKNDEIKTIIFIFLLCRNNFNFLTSYINLNYGKCNSAEFIYGASCFLPYFSILPRIQRERRSQTRPTENPASTSLA